MAENISVRIGKDLQNDLVRVEKTWKIDRSEAIRRLLAEAIKEWKINYLLNEIAQHKISVGKAASECGISIWEMLDLLKKKNIDWTGYEKGDLERDLALIK